MNSPIILLGNVPQQDADLLCEIGEKFSISVVACRRLEDLAAVVADTRPRGYISFLPSINVAAEKLPGLRGQEPDRAGLPVPLYQHFDGQELPAYIADVPILGLFATPLSPPVAWSMLNGITACDGLLLSNRVLTDEIADYKKQKHLLVEVGTALSRENDLNHLLDVILMVSRDIAGADAGSIYIRERLVPGGPFSSSLRFKVTQNDSVDVGRSIEFQLPMDKNSIAGYVASTGKAVKIDDLEKSESTMPFKLGRDYQKKLAYVVKSMLTLPLKNKDGEVVGVLQLINKKLDRAVRITSPEACAAAVVPFNGTDEEFIESVASQAAVSIERAQLHENIRELFEGFLRSSIAAIDERDHVTSGHSKRVMGYAMAFVEAAASDPDCPFAAIGATPERKRQFQFAALLHDIGKIGVPERVLTKHTRLSPCEFDAILSRLEVVSLSLKYEPELVSWKSMQEIFDDRRFLERVNNAGYLDDNDYRRISQLRDKRYRTAGGREANFLTEQEWKSLSVRAGNLTQEERELINSHASATYRILSKIPWTRQLEMIPIIAATHHEKMDGSGYPQGLTEKNIPIESKILAVIDIYEALVAQDRPYKPRRPPEKAIEILNQEVKAGHLDAGVVRFFTEKGIYKLYADTNQNA